MYISNTLTKLEIKAKKIKESQKISYNKALQVASKAEGFTSYQAFLNKVETTYCEDDNEYIKDFKSNLFKNRKHIKSNFIKLKNLKIKYDEITNDEQYNDNGKKEREELLENILYKADKIAKNIADLIFANQIVKFGDNQFTSLEAPSFNIYTSSNGVVALNDINGDKADFWLEIPLYSESFELGFKNLGNYNDIGFIVPEKYDPQNFNSINIELP